MNVDAPHPDHPATEPTPTYGERSVGASTFGGGSTFFAKDSQALPGTGTAPSAPPVTRPAPLPKRPKGRFFVGIVVSSILAFLVFAVWNSFGRYLAYGSVVGRVVKVSSPWDGIILSMHVREGDDVREGDVIAAVENLELKSKLEGVGDQLRIAQANLDAEIAKVQLQTKIRGDQNQKAVAEYYELWGELLQQRSKLAELKSRQQRSEFLKHHQAISNKDASSIRYTLKGQLAKVEKLEVAVERLRKRATFASDMEKQLQYQLKPKLVEIESLQRDLDRLSKTAQRGLIRAPTSGKIVRAKRYTGEFAQSEDALVELLADGSVEAVIYLPQDQRASYEQGETVTIRVSPMHRSIECKITRVGEQLTMAPKSLERYYRKHQQLLPVFVRPLNNFSDRISLRLGSEVRVPRRWPFVGT